MCTFSSLKYNSSLTAWNLKQKVYFCCSQFIYWDMATTLTSPFSFFFFFFLLFFFKHSPVKLLGGSASRSYTFLIPMSHLRSFRLSWITPLLCFINNSFFFTALVWEEHKLWCPSVKRENNMALIMADQPCCESKQVTSWWSSSLYQIADLVSVANHTVGLFHF